MTNYDKVIERLNDLIEKNYDAERGYKNAAENVQDASLINYFMERSKQRYDFGHAIKDEIRSLGGKVEKGGSVAGDIHRAWINFKAALSFDREEAILEECERGEQASLAEYDNVLKDTTLPKSTRMVLIKQRNAIQNALNRAAVLEEAYDA